MSPKRNAWGMSEKRRDSPAQGLLGQALPSKVPGQHHTILNCQAESLTCAHLCGRDYVTVPMTQDLAHDSELQLVCGDDQHAIHPSSCCNAAAAHAGLSAES